MLIDWGNIELFVALLARISAFVFILPVMGNRSIPVVAKVGLSGFLTVFLFSIMKGTMRPLPEETLAYVMVIVKEVLVGLTLGFITRFLFAGVQIAGEAVGRQIGFGLARVMDPGFQEQTSLISEFQLLFVFLIYLAIDGHHFLLEGLFESYRKIPVSGFIAGRGVEEHVVQMASQMFVSGVKISAPVIAALILTTVGLGLLARTVPQMNVFIVGLPLRIGVGLLGLILTMTLFMKLFQYLWVHFQNDFVTFLNLF